MQSDCPECDYWRSRGARFCSGCGKRLDEDVSNRSCISVGIRDRSGYRTCAHLATLCLLFIIVLSIAYELLYAGQIMDGLTGLGKAELVLATVVLIVSLAFALRGLYRSYTRENEEPGHLVRCGAAGTGVCLAVLLALSYVYVFAVMAMGLDIDASGFDRYTRYQMAALLIIAGPEEEFLFRLLPIGVVMMIVALVKRRKHPFAYLLGGFGTSRVAWIVIMASAIVFGMAHLDGWNMVKVPQAVIGGVIFGYVFVEYGFYASVLAHAANDCLTIVEYVYEPAGVLVILVLIAIGMVLAVYQMMRVRNGEFRCEKWLNDDSEDTLIERWNRH